MFIHLKLFVFEYVTICLIFIKRSNKIEEYPIGVYVLPKILDEKVAMLQLSTMDVDLTKMTEEQGKYYNVPLNGPFKSDQYRY